jgi:hypothetical protein
MENKTKGMWISIEIIKNHELDWTNKVLLSEIISLSKLERGCITSNESLGKLLSLHAGNVSRRISQLKDLGYIKIVLKKKDVSTTLRIIVPTDKKYDAETHEGVSGNALTTKRKRTKDYAETHEGVSGNAPTTKRERSTTKPFTNSFIKSSTKSLTNPVLKQKSMYEILLEENNSKYDKKWEEDITINPPSIKKENNISVFDIETIL